MKLRSCLFVIVLSFMLLGCAYTGGFASHATTSCVDELTAYCARECRERGAVALGFMSVYPFDNLRCACELPKPPQPGIFL